MSNQAVPHIYKRQKFKETTLSDGTLKEYTYAIKAFEVSFDNEAEKLKFEQSLDRFKNTRNDPTNVTSW